MKRTFFGIAIIAASFMACNNNNKAKETEISPIDTIQTNIPATKAEERKPVSIDEIVSSYLLVKDALVDDNGKEAAAAGTKVSGAIGNVDTASLTIGQKKLYNDLADDIKEHAGHIGANSGKIAHQREHFDMLSNDIYDLVKEFGTEQTLYKAYCPMYNDDKGASWITEVKEIKNPYFGKKMLTCGSIKETIKPGK